ncbi:rhomboid family intramembrane serine protease [Apibacter muscae]|uniref:Rhomboid family intramembrane serine protease n=1 Tax=Apibacter muscae TaxID=2509004 RepID=A0A563DKS4_9FLAO|nr:rhomboid family intramembrane serine protease [Apibacter muscae]TWP30551.1 rhomboid family intramembrane serine protease [Apibacter muscae]TWP31388.1 rhomboid family intramembrane serine protease [Apibacter muscae]
MKKFSIKKEALIIPFLLVGFIWTIFIIQSTIGFKDCYGVIPLSFKGLRGIFLAPLFHGNLQHIVSNTVPLFVLTFFIFQFYRKLGYFVLVNGWILSGLIVWVIPDLPILHSTVLSCHIGASGIVYLLAFFLFFSGIFRKKNHLMAVSLLVVFLYGSLVWGMLPGSVLGIYDTTSISWESHLAGGITGMFLAYILRNIGNSKHNFSKHEEHFEIENEKLWEEYKEQFPEDFSDKNQLKHNVSKELESIKGRINYKETEIRDIEKY